MSLLGFYRVFIEVCVVPLGFGNGLTVLCGISLGFYRVLLGFITILLFIGARMYPVFKRVLPDPKIFYRVLPSFY